MDYMFVGDVISKAKAEKCGNRQLPVLSMTMHDGIVFQDERFKKQIASIDQSTYNVVQRKQLVVSFPIDEGVLAIQDITDIGIVSPTYKIWDVDQNKIIPKYLELFLRSPHSIQYYKAKLRGSTARRRSITDDQFLSMEIPFLSLQQQQKVINIIQKAQELIDLYKQQLQGLDDLIKARFVEMFEKEGLPIKTIEDMCSQIVDCPHTTPKYEGELKNPAIRTSEIKKGYITWDTMRYVSDEEYNERIVRLQPQAGDIVYGREGTFGNAAILPKGYNFCLGQRVMLLRPNYSKCTSEYLLYAVISDDIYRQAKEKNNASTVAHVNVKDVKSFRIPQPPLEDQKVFSVFVQQVDKSKVVVQKALDETQLLFDSLMQQYFE